MPSFNDSERQRQLDLVDLVEGAVDAGDEACLLELLKDAPPLVWEHALECAAQNDDQPVDLLQHLLEAARSGPPGVDVFEALWWLLENCEETLGLRGTSGTDAPHGRTLADLEAMLRVCNSVAAAAAAADGGQRALLQRCDSNGRAVWERMMDACMECDEDELLDMLLGSLRAAGVCIEGMECGR